MEEAELAASLKELRHRLSLLEERFPGGRSVLVAARDTAGDVGARVAEERYRKDAFALAAAGWKRVQEALRVLEEVMRTVAGGAAYQAKHIRFDAYDLEKLYYERAGLYQKKNELSRAHLYFVVGRADTGGRPLRAVVEEAIAGGARIVQLREKTNDVREVMPLARELRAITRERGVLYIINDRVDIAAAVDADGVHLGQDDLPIEDARRVLGIGKIIGISTHSIRQAQEAERRGADYIGVGPVFPTTTKDCTPVGLGLVTEVAKSVRIPFFAIGGINSANIEQVLQAGACRVAVVSAVAAAPDARAAAAALYGAIYHGTGGSQ